MNSISIVPTVTAEQLQNRLTTIQNEFKYSFFGRLVTPSREQITKINDFITEVDSASSEVLGKLDTTSLQNIEKHIQVLKARCWEYEKPTGFAFRILEFFGFAILHISLSERLTQVVNSALQERGSQIPIAPQSLTTGEFTISQSKNGSQAIAMLGTATITGTATIAGTVKLEVRQQLKQQGALFDDEQAVETSLRERKSLQESPLPLGIFWLKGETPMVTQYRSGTFYHRELDFGVGGHAISYSIGSGDNLKRIGAASLDHLAPAGVRISLKGSTHDFRDMQFMRELQRRMQENGQWLGETSLQKVQEEAQKARRFISYIPDWFPKWFSRLYPQQKTVFGYGIDQVSGVPFYLKIDQEGSLRIQTDERGDMITQDYADDNLERAVGFNSFQAKIAGYLKEVDESRRVDEKKAPDLDAVLRQIEGDRGFQVATAKHAKTCMQELAGAFEGVEGLYAITSSFSKDAKEPLNREYEITYIKDKKVHDVKLQVRYVGAKISYALLENTTKEFAKEFSVTSLQAALTQLGCTQPYSDEVESKLTTLYAQQADFLNNFIGAYNDRLHTEAEVQAELSKMDHFLAGTQGRRYIIWKDVQSQYQVSFISGTQVSFQVHFDIGKQQVFIGKVQIRSEEDLLSHFKQYNLVSQKEVKKLQIAQHERIREVTSYLTTTINKQKFLERIARVQQIDPSMAVGAYYICKQLDSESGPNTCLHYTLYVNTTSGLQEIAIDLESCPGKVLMGGQEIPAFAQALKSAGAFQRYEELGVHLFAIKQAFADVKNGVFKPQEVSNEALTNSMAQVIEGLGSRCKERLPVWAIQYTPPPSAPIVTRAITYVWNAVFGGEPTPLESAGTYSLVVFREKMGAKEAMIETVITQQRHEILYDPLKKKFRIKGGKLGDVVESTSVEELVAKQVQLGSNIEAHAIENVKAQIALEEARYRPLIDHQNFVGHSDVIKIGKQLVASQGRTPFILYRTKGAPVQLEGHGELMYPTHGTYYAAWIGTSGEIYSAPYKIYLTKNSDKYAFWLDVTEAQQANMPPELVKFKPLS